MRVYKIYLLLVGLALAMLAGCSTDTTVDISRLRPQIPVYPNAQQLTQRESTDERTRERYTQLISFQTSDEPAAVVAFYEQALAQDGWNAFTPPRPVSYAVYFSKTIQLRTPVVYGMLITATRAGNAQTFVEINMAEYLEGG